MKNRMLAALLCLILLSSCGGTPEPVPLEELPEDGGQVDAFLRNKLRGRTPDEKEKRRLTNALLRRGFPWGEVKSAWRRMGEEIEQED